MKRIFTLFFLCFFCCYSFVIACEDGKPCCEHRKYGHRRALLNKPFIFVSGKEVPYCYEKYFKEQATKAMKLREDLIKTGALIPENEHSQLRQMACKVLESPSQREVTLAEIKKVLDEQAIVLDEQTIVKSMSTKQKQDYQEFVKNLVKETCKGNGETKKIVLKFLQSSQKKKGTNIFTVQEEKTLADKKVDINPLRENIDHKLREIACIKIKKIVEDIKKEVQAKDRNIASFGFVFFDQEGKKINEQPFYFSPQASLDTLETPFFFLSGRRHRDYHLLDPYPWIALPESAPKNIDRNLIPMPSRQGAPTIEKAFKNVLHEYHWSSIERLGKAFKQTLKDYEGSLTEALMTKAEKETFFHYIYTRSKGNKPRVSKKDVCTSLLTLLELPAWQLPEPSLLFYPKEKDPKSNENEEKDFTHSEQYALFQASSTFEPFVNACINHIKLEDSVSPQVGSCAVLIYTYNIMCARCAQSTIIDFTRTDSRNSKSFHEIINEKLKNLYNDNSFECSMVFMAGYTHNYESQLHGSSCDFFEKYVREKAPLASEVDNILGASMIPDLTLGNEGYKGYEVCSPEESPEMIYHVHIPSEQNANQAENPPSILQKIKKISRHRFNDNSYDEEPNKQNKLLADPQDPVSTTEYSYEALEGFIGDVQSILGVPCSRKYTFDGKEFIKGKVSPDGTCFIDSLNLLFPDKGISRDEFVKRMRNARNGNNPIITRDEVDFVLGTELYSQLREKSLSGMSMDGERTDFSGLTINQFLKSFSLNSNLSIIIPKIIKNKEIMNEIVDCLVYEKTYFSLPAQEIHLPWYNFKNIGSTGLVCKFFSLNLDIYSPDVEENTLILNPVSFRFDRGATPKAVFFKSSHFDPLCGPEELETRKRFAINEIKMIQKKESFYADVCSNDPFASEIERERTAKIEKERSHLLTLYRAGQWSMAKASQN